MQPTVKPKTAVPWAIPAATWIASICVVAAGFSMDMVYLALGFVLVATSVLVTIMAFGTATALMDVPAATSPASFRDRTEGAEEREFFPKGAISFFLALIAFMGSAWLALYALMIHHGRNI